MTLTIDKDSIETRDDNVGWVWFTFEVNNVIRIHANIHYIAIEGKTRPSIHVNRSYKAKDGTVILFKFEIAGGPICEITDVKFEKEVTTLLLQTLEERREYPFKKTNTSVSHP